MIYSDFSSLYNVSHTLSQLSRVTKDVEEQPVFQLLIYNIVPLDIYTFSFFHDISTLNLISAAVIRF